MFNITPVATRVNSGSNCAGMLVKMGPYNRDYCFFKDFIRTAIFLGSFVALLMLIE